MKRSSSENAQLIQVFSELGCIGTSFTPFVFYRDLKKRSTSSATTFIGSFSDLFPSPFLYSFTLHAFYFHDSDSNDIVRVKEEEMIEQVILFVKVEKPIPFLTFFLLSELDICVGCVNISMSLIAYNSCYLHYLFFRFYLNWQNRTVWRFKAI